MRTNATPARKQAPVINFGCPTTQSTLDKLIADFCAAERELAAALNTQEEVPEPPRLKVEIYGGETEEVRIKRGYNPEQIIPAGAWCYRSREDIERNHRQDLAAAKTNEERSAVEAKTDALLAEYNRLERAHKRSIPKAYRAAARRVDLAHRALTRAELAVINHRPSNISDAVALLTFAGGDERASKFMVDEAELRHVMKNVSIALQALAN